MIEGELGALLWRRVYEARVNLRTVVTMNHETLEALLQQAAVPEPDDDVVTGPLGRWHGRTMETKAAVAIRALRDAL